MSNKYIEPMLEDIVYERVFGNLAHFSFKLMNTNAKGAIRIDENNVSKNLYACVETSISHGNTIAKDYFKGAGEAKAFKHLRLARAVIDERLISELNEKSVVRQSKPLTAEQKKAKNKAKDLQLRREAKLHFAPVLTIYDKADSSFHLFEEEKLNPRLTQILLPKDGQYVSVTPIASSGFGLHIANRRREKKLSLKSAQRSVGGANSQNVGGLTYYITEPLVTGCPKENKRLKEVLAIFYKGVPFRYSKSDFNDFIDWKAQKAASGESVNKNRKYIEKQEMFIRKILSPLVKSINAAQNILAEHEHLLSGKSGGSENQFIPTDFLASHEFRRKNIKEISLKIIGKLNIQKDSKGRSLGFDVTELNRLSKIIGEKING